MKVANKSVISIRYRMKNSKGEILEDIMDGSPISYLHGTGQIMPLLEINLAGLKSGDRKNFVISSENGFPGMDDEFYFEVIIDSIRHANKEELEKGKIFEAYTQNCDANCNC